ncbi:excisionase family DNA binding protein [Saccharothrix tamanrassetensis]|uniref:Excisionase family DNA binding protein n=1 Tax=Saccharothrix tamanrassetensis TaxID=1051531 RepID=A0A841CQT1_9PSEU|nr:helix-turn-helix domain-containing protein [Saccharothrix tamanrassetensis]MBB5958407.1 excisionase family DNA binding protein [Saccharothrix tamanrassetensis]
MNTEPDTVIPVRKYLYKVSEAMEMLSLSRSVFYEQMRAGRIKYVKQGRATFIPSSAITAYVELLEREAGIGYGETA